MKVRPSDDRALGFSAYISFIGPTLRHMLFIHGRIPSLENCIFDLPSACKGLVMDAHRVTLKDGSPPGS